MKIGILWDAVKSGKELPNPATWKTVQVAGNVLYAVLAGLAVLLPYIGVKPEYMPSDEMLLTLANGLAGIGVAWNVYFTAATTKKIGVGDAPAASHVLPDDASKAIEVAVQPKVENRVPDSPMPGHPR